MTENAFKENLVNAWTKIRKYCEENLAGTPNGIVAKFPHNPYYWMLLAVDSNGEPQLHYGGHGWGTDDLIVRDSQMEFSPASMEGNLANMTSRSNKCSHTTAEYFEIMETKSASRVADLLTGRRTRFNALEELVNNWKMLKAQLHEKHSQVLNVSDFEP